MTLPSQQTQHFITHARWPFLTLRSTYRSALAYKTHRHETVSLGVVIEGATQSKVEDQVQMLHQGDMILIPNQCSHSCNPQSGSRSYHMLHIDKNWCLEQLGGTPEQHVFAVKQSLIQDLGLFSQMAKWLSDFPEAPAECLQTLETIIKQFGQLKPHHSFEYDRVVHSDLSVQALAQELNMSKEGFIRLVKRHTGLSPLALRHNQRIEQAKQLISEGHPLVDVALQVGYHDQSQFHKHFVHFTAATPKQYQQSVIKT